jgi:hypothetical protein
MRLRFTHNPQTPPRYNFAAPEQSRSWHRSGGNRSIPRTANRERFCDESKFEIYDLSWWHTLSGDLSPLGYVTALQFGLREDCHSCPDFDSGVGAGSLLFVQHGFNVGLADISSPLMTYVRWGFQLRRLTADFFDLKTASLHVAASTW